MQASGSRGLAHTENEMDEGDPTHSRLVTAFEENLEDLETHVPAHFSEREISDSEDDASKMETQKWKHSVHAYFCKKQKRSILRTEKYGDKIGADHKVLNEGSESRNKHRYPVVVEDLATQWILSCPCKNKNSHETEKSLRKFLEPSQHRTDRKRMGLVKEQHAELRKGHLQYCCNQVRMKNGGWIPWTFHGMLLLSAKHSRSLV